MDDIKYCYSCGEKLQNGSRFCPNCGTKMIFESGEEIKNMTYCCGCGKKLEHNSKFCSGCGRGVNVAKMSASEKEEASNDNIELPMKFYNFMVNYGYYISAAIWFLNAIISFSGSGYLISSEDMYHFYPGLSVVDKLFGLIWIIFGAVTIVIRNKFAGFKADAISFWGGWNIVGIIATALYSIIQKNTIDNSSLVPTSGFMIFVTVVISAYVLYLEMTYYRKREHLFINYY